MWKQTAMVLALPGLLCLSGCGGNTSTLAIREFPLPGGAQWITAGPNGNLWFTETNGARIGRITPAGQVTEFPLPPDLEGVEEQIIAGPDGNLWFSDFDGDRIGSITPTRQVRVFSLPNPQRITLGQHGNLWVALGGEVGRIIPAGQITRFALPQESIAVEMVAGPDGALWFAEPHDDKIRRISLGK